MDLKKYYKQLYELQDAIFDIFFEIESEFYLTGGTCLNRFYINARYSDDLDFFTPYTDEFGKIIREFILKLEKSSFNFSREIINRTFARIKIIKNSIILIIDFVNDPVKHFGEIKKVNNKIKIDNYKNIFSNKLSTIIDRDEPKDVFDAFIIWKNFDINWNEIIIHLKEKTNIEFDFLIFRLKSFPIEWIERLRFVNIEYKTLFYNDFQNFISNIESSLIEL